MQEMQETQVRSLKLEMASHSSILAWRIPWTEEPSSLQSMGSQRVRHNWAHNTHTHTHTQVTVILFLSKNKTLSTFYNNLPEHRLAGALLGRGFSWKPQICLLAPRGIQPSVFVNQLGYLQWYLPFQCPLLLLWLIHYPPELGLASSVISMTSPTAPTWPQTSSLFPFHPTATSSRPQNLSSHSTA